MSTIQNTRGLKVSVGLAVQRQTPKTDFGTVLGKGVSKAADVVLTAGQLATPYVPGGAVVSAAVSGLGALKSSVAGSAAAPAPNSNQLMSSGTMAGTPAGGSGGSAMGDVADLAAGGDKASKLMMATQEMQEMNQTFNLQYLKLQQKMQGDNRQFTAMSNIMKTKHDTAKNAINNVR